LQIWKLALTRLLQVYIREFEKENNNKKFNQQQADGPKQIWFN
jgi:hypothetical protein